MVERKIRGIIKSLEMTTKYDFLAIVGPTASGKTGKAVSLSRKLQAEIISCDSRQVYSGMDIGTGKDLDEYGEVKFHLIDVAEAGEKYNLYRFLKDFSSVYENMKSRNVFPVLCGGSGMYVEAVLSGISMPEVPPNPELRENLSHHNLEELSEILKEKKSLHNRTDIDTKKRAIRAIEIADYYEKHPEVSILADRTKVEKRNGLIIGVDIPREERRQKITQRLEKRLENGMIQEVETLLKKGVDKETLIYYGLEYKFITLYLAGNLTYEEMKKKLEIAIHQFSKRQMTWFRGMEKRGFPIHWISYNKDEEEFAEEVMSLLEA